MAIHTKKLWELKLPRPPKKTNVLEEIILAHMSPYEPDSVQKLHYAVINDYGDVCLRTVIRAVRRLEHRGRISRITEEGQVLGYIRMPRCQTRRVQSSSRAAG